MARRWPATLRQRLLLGLALPLSLVLVLALLIHDRQALDLAEQGFDQALMNTAVALAARLEIDTDNDLDVDLPVAAQAALRADRVDEMRLAVFDERGRLVWGEAELAACAVEGAGGSPRFATRACRGQVLRMLVLERQGPMSRARILVGETTLKREQAAAAIRCSAAAVGLALWSVALLTVWLVTRRVLAPLERAAAQIDARGGAELQPLPAEGMPAELGVLLGALNGLIARLGEVAQSQRRMLADVAHQLRTPLAGLSLQIELLAQDAAGPGQAARRAQIGLSLRRMQGQVDKLLALARASAQAGAQEALRPCDLAAVAEACAESVVDLAAARGQTLDFELEPAPVSGREGELQELACNLIENALQHGGGRITVRSGRLPGPAPGSGASYLEVEDQGPGIPAELLGRLFERHARGAGSAGSGLGLAIVKLIADQHGARIETGRGAGGQGARLRVLFEPASAVGSPAAKGAPD